MKFLAKLYLTINDPLPVLSGKEQDLGHEYTVNTYLFYKVCKVYDIVCSETSIPIQRSHDILVSDIFA